MGSAPTRPSVSLGRLLRLARESRGLSLRDVSERTARGDDRIPVSSLVRIEQGKQEPGVRRLNTLLRLYRLELDLVGEMLQLEDLVVDLPEIEHPEVMFRRALSLLESGDFARAMAHLIAVRELVPRTEETKELRQHTMLAFAVFARNRGKYRLAKRLLQDLLCEPPVPAMRVRVLLVESSVWVGLGSLDMALAAVARAETCLASDDGKEARWLLHTKAKLQLREGNLDLAKETLKKALALYEKSGDSHGRAKALMLKIDLLESDGNIAGAVECARGVITWCVDHGHEELLIGGELELGRLLVENGQADEGVAALRRALGRAVLLADKNTEFLAHLRLWKAYESLGDHERAVFEREATCHFVNYVDDYLPEVAEVRRLLEAGGPLCPTEAFDTS